MRRQRTCGVGRDCRREAATTTGITVEARARFGYTAPIGTTDDGRMRRITVHLPAEYARRLLDAQRGIGAQSPNEVIAEGVQEVHFKDHGRRAGLSIPPPAHTSSGQT
ncbi:telomere-protecting terminal protein Tpg [Streptomyces sp. NPDC086549]|uniref:telomere-protecting terminal protein Tpg n=1 Tax=Streptomyces sp. NPDC086549 TaxID=3365752 RepID=UPI003815261B